MIWLVPIPFDVGIQCPFLCEKISHGEFPQFLAPTRFLLLPPPLLSESMMNVTGTIVNYYIHCRRQCWLFGHGMNFEDDSEDVHIGRILHEIRSESTKDAEILMDGIRMDQITAEYVLEMKKSDADIEAARWQTLYYLYVLKQKGIVRKGKIQFIERNKQVNKTVELELDDDNERGIVTLVADIKSLLEQEAPPEPIHAKTCDRCAYYSYCYV